jgi:tetratricopeptide (TPR) repeat protein
MRWLGIFIIFLVFMTIFGDFTPRLHKNILHAQDYIRNQNYKAAIQEYELILKSNPPAEIRVKIYYQLGELYSVNLTQNDKSLFYFSKVKKVAKDLIWEVKAEERMGEINFSFLKDYSASAKNYEKLASWVPALESQEFYQFRLAQSLLNKGDLDLAEKKFIEIQSDPGHLHHILAFYYRGLISFERKKWKESILHWKKYIRREKKNDAVVETKFLMANAYETMEELKKAYNLYYSILGEYPNTQVIKNRLESIYARRIARKR